MQLGVIISRINRHLGDIILPLSRMFELAEAIVHAKNNIVSSFRKERTRFSAIRLITMFNMKLICLLIKKIKLLKL